MVLLKKLIRNISNTKLPTVLCGTIKPVHLLLKMDAEKVIGVLTAYAAYSEIYVDDILLVLLYGYVNFLHITSEIILSFKLLLFYSKYLNFSSISRIINIFTHKTLQNTFKLSILNCNID